MNKKKEGLSTAAREAIAEAARANVNATIETAKSAVSAFVDTVTGGTEKRSGKRRSIKKGRSIKKKAAARSKSGKARSSAAKGRLQLLNEGSPEKPLRKLVARVAERREGPLPKLAAPRAKRVRVLPQSRVGAKSGARAEERGGTGSRAKTLLDNIGRILGV
jgi:hypothetical protein